MKSNQKYKTFIFSASYNRRQETELQQGLQVRLLPSNWNRSANWERLRLLSQLPQHKLKTSLSTQHPKQQVIGNKYNSNFQRLVLFHLKTWKSNTPKSYKLADFVQVYQDELFICILFNIHMFFLVLIKYCPTHVKHNKTRNDQIASSN